MLALCSILHPTDYAKNHAGIMGAGLELINLVFHKTMERVKQRYYWPGNKRDVQAWISECVQCQQRKTPTQAPFTTVETKYPFNILSWDILGPLPLTSQRNKYVLVIIDLISKWTEALLEDNR